MSQKDKPRRAGRDISVEFIPLEENEQRIEKTFRILENRKDSKTQAEGPGRGENGNVQKSGNSQSSNEIHVMPNQNQNVRRVSRPEVGLNSLDYRMKAGLRERIIYSFYLAIVCFIAFGMVHANMFYFTYITSSVFYETEGENGKTLSSSVTMADFWIFAQTTLLDMLYWEHWYSNQDPVQHTDEDDKKLLYENQLLGLVRMRQVRVRSDSCSVHGDVQRLFKQCFGFFDVFNEETNNISPLHPILKTQTAWKYTQAEKFGTYAYTGEISTYGGGGYYVDLPKTREEAKKMILELKDNLWISRATRAVFIDFTLYNANVNLFGICKLIVEFPPVGGIMASKDFEAVKLFRYVSNWDYFILGCEMIFLFFTVYFTWEEVRVAKMNGLQYLSDWWNFLDFISIVIAYICVILWIVRLSYATSSLSGIGENTDKHIDLRTAARIQTLFNTFIALLVFFAFVKVFKFLNFNKAMIEIAGTLSKSVKFLVGFTVMFVIIFFAFAQLGYLLFGTQVKDYRNIRSSSMAVLQIVLGEFDYKQIEEASPIFGSLYFIVLVFIIYFVSANMIIAIINDSYWSVKSEVNVNRKGAIVAEYFERGYRNFLKMCCCGLHKRCEKPDSKEVLQHMEVRKVLKRAQFTDLEIDMFFAKYDVNTDSQIDEEESKRLIEDLELRRLHFPEDKESEELKSVKKELEWMQKKLRSIEIEVKRGTETVDSILEYASK